MTGTIIQHKPKKGRKTFGYSIFLGRDETGKQLRQVRRGFSTEKEAQRALRDALEELERTPAPQRTMPTFREFYARWHQEVVMRMHGTKTYENSHQHAEYAIRRFGDTPLDQLTPEQLTRDMNWLEDHGGKKSKLHPDGRPLSSD
jgi:hypothetical protein